MERLLHVNRLGKFLQSEKNNDFWSLSESLNLYPLLLQLRDTIQLLEMMHLNHYPLTNYILDIIVERQYKIEFLKQAPNGEQIGVD